MAGPNESNKRGMNTFADDIDRSSTLSELERIGQRAGRKGIQRTELEDRIRGEGKLLNSLMDQGRETPEFRTSPFYQQQTSSLRESIRGLRGRMNSLDATANTRAESEASSYIARQFGSSAINGQASTMQREAMTQNRAFSMSGMSHDEIQARREDVLADIRVRERNAQNEVKGMYSGRGQVNPERSAAIGVMMEGTRNSVRELATLNAAQALQKYSGNDPNAKLRNLAEMGQVAQGITNASSVAKEVNSGAVQTSGGKIANADIAGAIIQTAEKLNKALADLAATAADDTKALETHRATADAAAGDLKKLQDAQKAGGGGPGNGAAIAMGLAGGFNALGQGAQAIMVNQRQGQVSNVASFANIANSQYDMYTKARGGDIASQLALGGTGQAKLFGQEMRTASNTVSTLGVAAGAAQAGAGVAQTMEASAQKANLISYGMGNSTANTQALIGGIQNTVQGATAGTINAMDMKRGVTAGANMAAGYNNTMEATKAVNAVSASQAQGLRNMITDLDVVGQGMGSRAGAFISESASTENLAAMAKAGISPEQFAQLSGQGVNDMGSQFNAKQIFASRNLESRGFGSAQMNMGRMSQLAQAGGNNPQAGLENVLSAAVSKGLDSSKSINDMVANTATMVSSSAGAAVGIDTTGAASSMLANSINPLMANKEFAVQQAMTAAEATKRATTNTDLSFTGMANTAGLQHNLAKAGIQIGGLEALSVQGVDMATLKSLQGKPGEAAKFFQNKGVNVTEKNANTFLETTMIEKERQILREGGLATGYDLEGLRKKATSKEGIVPGSAEYRQMGQIAEVQGRTGGADELIRELRGVKAPNVAADAGKSLTTEAGTDEVKKAADALRTSGFKQLSEAAKQASTDLGGFAGAMKTFMELQEKFEKEGAENEKVFATAASDFAKNFELSTGRFDKSVTKFEGVMANLSKVAGLNSNGRAFIPNGLNEKKGSQGDSGGSWTDSQAW